MSRSRNNSCKSDCGLCKRPEKEVRRKAFLAALKQEEQEAEECEPGQRRYDEWAKDEEV